MTRLSVNINKLATLRNARGGNNPDVVKAAQDCERFGAQGVTVHPRPDERHIRYADVIALAEVVKTEFNIEGNPDARYFELVEKARPAQATLVPDADDQLTSDHGWDTVTHRERLKDLVARLHGLGVRVSIFVDADERMVEGAAETGADRIELYTYDYARDYAGKSPAQAVDKYVRAAKLADGLGLEVNAGHDLDLENLKFFADKVKPLHEVSIGHALICDAIYLGLENAIQLYRRQLG